MLNQTLVFSLFDSNIQYFTAQTCFQLLYTQISKAQKVQILLLKKSFKKTTVVQGKVPSAVIGSYSALDILNPLTAESFRQSSSHIYFSSFYIFLLKCFFSWIARNFILFLWFYSIATVSVPCLPCSDLLGMITDSIQRPQCTNLGEQRFLLLK